MFCFLCKELLHGRPNKIVASQSQKLLYILRNNPSILLSLKSISSTANQHSFAVTYLTENCGLSPESALSASKCLNFKTPDKPDSVIALLKNHGFSKTQIASLIGKLPKVLAANVEKTLLPKLEFFYSRGFSRSDLAEHLSKYPNTLGYSLEKQIIPSFNLLRNLLLSDEKTINTIKQFPRILLYDLDGYILPNIDILRKHGVPEYNIVKILCWHPKLFCRAPTHVEENVEKVKEMGFKPDGVAFVMAVSTLGSLSKSTWERKFDAYKKCGWSREEVLETFRKFPLIMTVSEDKIMAMMDFLVNRMGLKVSLIAKRPRVLSMSLEKRIVPRGLFALDLLSKGLVNQELRLSEVFESSEKLFLQRFVYEYEEKASELLKLYNEKFNLSVRGKLCTNKS